MAGRIKKFRRFETTYTCRCCKKLTRNTGDEGSCGLCVDCFNLAGWENVLLDEGVNNAREACGPEVKAILTKRPELCEKFPELAAMVA